MRGWRVKLGIRNKRKEKQSLGRENSVEFSLLFCIFFGRKSLKRRSQKFHFQSVSFYFSTPRVWGSTVDSLGNPGSKRGWIKLWGFKMWVRERERSWGFYWEKKRKGFVWCKFCKEKIWGGLVTGRLALRFIFGIYFRFYFRDLFQDRRVGVGF